MSRVISLARKMTAYSVVPWATLWRSRRISAVPTVAFWRSHASSVFILASCRQSEEKEASLPR
jgi:hypothetical protein